MKAESYIIAQNNPTDVRVDGISTLVQHGGSTVAVIIAMSLFMLAVAKYSETILKARKYK